MAPKRLKPLTPQAQLDRIATSLTSMDLDTRKRQPGSFALGPRPGVSPLPMQSPVLFALGLPPREQLLKVWHNFLLCVQYQTPASSSPKAGGVLWTGTTRRAFELITARALRTAGRTASKRSPDCGFVVEHPSKRPRRLLSSCGSRAQSTSCLKPRRQRTIGRYGLHKCWRTPIRAVARRLAPPQKSILQASPSRGPAPTRCMLQNASRARTRVLRRSLRVPGSLRRRSSRRCQRCRLLRCRST